MRQEFEDPRHLYKLFMTPTTSHVVFNPAPGGGAATKDGPVPPPSMTQLMREISLNNRPRWLAEETLSRPVAQLLPKPSPLNDVFLHAWGPLFGGIVE